MQLPVDEPQSAIRSQKPPPQVPILTQFELDDEAEETMAKKLVVIAHLGREQSLGAKRRVRSMRGVFEEAGARVEELQLIRECRSDYRDLARSDFRRLISGDIVPEALAWSLSKATRRLDELNPDLIVCNTARSFHPRFIERWPVILDLVDRLSASYADRAHAPGGGPRRVIFGLLAPTARRFEHRWSGDRITTIAAGYADSESFGVTWVPNTVETDVLPAGQDKTDVVFFGNLSYPPNIEAVQEISNFWPLVRRQRPDATMLIAGAFPSKQVMAAVEQHGWSIWPDFPDLKAMLASARLAVAPLRHTSGIQSKVIEAAAFGVPQIVSSPAMAGLAPGFPAEIADDDVSWANRIVELLDDGNRLTALGRAAQQHVADTYSVQRWTTWALNALAGTGR